MTLRDVVGKVKEHLNMKTFRLAIANGKSLGNWEESWLQSFAIRGFNFCCWKKDDTIKVIAVGAGSGSKLLNNCKADLIITGEFDHHEILHEMHRGVSLIVTDHSNTERLYYKYFRESFNQLLSKYNESVEILISEKDRDPLEYV